MNKRLLFFALITSLSAFLLVPVGNAQQPNVSARQALSGAASQLGPGAVQWLAEVRGQTGIPQPQSWEILAFDERSPRLLHRYWFAGGRAGDAGADESRYPVNIPVGYFSANQVAVDSVAAFTIAEGEARKAQMAFDSCDYLLRVREYSNEPIWRLELLDPARRLVGKIYLSATNGEVLRTVWVYYNQGALPSIVDSMAPGRSQMLTSSAPAPANPPIQEPGTTGNTGIYSPAPTQPPSTPGVAGNQVPPPPLSPTFPSANGRTGGLLPYEPPQTAPLPPANGRTYNDGGIPEPPAIANQSMPDLRDEPIEDDSIDPSQPPIDVPESSGSTERIPPPPVPQP